MKIPTTIRCLAVSEGGQWVTQSLEFGLAAQSSDLGEAKQKLESQIRDYARIALSESPEFRDQLLNRRAPLSAYMVWYALSVRLGILEKLKMNSKVARHAELFDEPFPQLQIA